jgi:hypothetical protein
MQNIVASEPLFAQNFLIRTFQIFEKSCHLAIVIFPNRNEPKSRKPDRRAPGAECRMPSKIEQVDCPEQI